MTPHQTDLLIARLAVLLIAFPLHELAHAYLADRLGDDTPRLAGRLSLNPLKQLNVLGSVLLILFGVGWASVPITPQKLRPNPLTGHMRVAMVGPLVNLILAVLIVLPGQLPMFRELAIEFSYLNWVIFLLNMLPLPPFDGFYVWRGLAPKLLTWLEPYGGWLLVGLVIGSFISGWPVFDWLVFQPARAITLWFY